jgi:hypothetical protein
MRIGAKIILSTGIDTARDGLAELAGSGWMMNLPQRREAHCGHSARHPTGHPAGHARPGLPGNGAEPGPVAVTFGKQAASAGSVAVLPVQWESVEPGDEFTVMLDGDITLAPADEQAHSTLALAGFCRLPHCDLIAEDYALARKQVIEAVRTFITSVAVTVTCSAEPGREQGPPGPASSWLTGFPEI